MKLTEYQKDVLTIIKSNIEEGEKREKLLKESYLLHYGLEESQYTLHFHTQSLARVLEKICKNTKQEWSYEQILEFILDEINSGHLGYKRYEGFSSLDIQYMAIVQRLAFTLVKQFENYKTKKN